METEADIAVDSTFDPHRHPPKLNLGCGFDKREGYVNVDFRDFHDPDLVADVRDLSMLPSDYYDEVLAQDVLEHLPRADALPALREWARVLAPGGLLRLRLPNLIGLMDLLVAKPTLAEQEELVQCLYGTQAYTGDWHCNGFTELTLRHYLHEAGFPHPTFEPFDEWMFDITVHKEVVDGPVELGDLPFMRPRCATAGSVVVAGEQADAGRRLEEHLATAEATVDLDVLPGETRMRPAKQAMLRVLRLVTHRQAAHNRAVVAALRDLKELHERR